MDKISVVGLGKLGQCLAACFAARGFETIGVDIDERVVDSINEGIATAIEPGLQEFIATAGRRLSATQNHEEAIGKTFVQASSRMGRAYRDLSSTKEVNDGQDIAGASVLALHLKTALLQTSPTVGDLTGNAERIVSGVWQA